MNTCNKHVCKCVSLRKWVNKAGHDAAEEEKNFEEDQGEEDEPLLCVPTKPSRFLLVVVIIYLVHKE